MYDYHIPFYLPGVETFSPFASEFSKQDISFLKLKYRISKDCFKSRLEGNPTLDNVISYIGKCPFASLGVDRRKYRLLVEERNSETFYDTITETYGFAPNYVFNTYGIASVQFAGHSESSSAEKLVEINYDVASQSISFVGAFYKSDQVYFHRPHKYTSGYEHYDAYSNVITLTDDGEGPAPTWTNTNSGATFDTLPIIQGQERGAPVYIVLKKRLISSRNDTVNINTQTQFFLEKPEIIKRTRLVDSLGNETLDATDARFAADGGLYLGKYCIEDSSINFDNELGLWRRDIKLTEWKTF